MLPTCYQYATNESFLIQSKTTCTKKEPPFTDGFFSAFKRYSCLISIDSDCSSSSSSMKSSTPILCALMVMLLPIMLPIIFVQLALSRFYHKNNIYQPRTRVRDVKWQKYRYVDETKRALSRKLIQLRPMFSDRISHPIRTVCRRICHIANTTLLLRFHCHIFRQSYRYNIPIQPNVSEGL